MTALIHVTGTCGTSWQKDGIEEEETTLSAMSTYRSFRYRCFLGAGSNLCCLDWWVNSMSSIYSFPSLIRQILLLCSSMSDEQKQDLNELFIRFWEKHNCQSRGALINELHLSWNMTRHFMNCTDISGPNPLRGYTIKLLTQYSYIHSKSHYLKFPIAW